MQRERRVSMFDIFLHMYEYGALRSIEAILRRRKGRGRITEGMNQTGVYCMHIWKCHSETSCTTIM
jgi:hypothetical protein